MEAKKRALPDERRVAKFERFAWRFEQESPGYNNFWLAKACACIGCLALWIAWLPYGLITLINKGTTMLAVAMFIIAVIDKVELVLVKMPETSNMLRRFWPARLFATIWVWINVIADLIFLQFPAAIWDLSLLGVLYFLSCNPKPTWWKERFIYARRKTA
ncbi:MAG: hypothetical protein JO019_04685 [Candidatus Kaiserbacteria bacterium]|nr:hypothetical protein [Candidatus Kaiserbacteria bacterium]